MRKKAGRNEAGAIAIEASLGIFFFLLSICCIMFFSQFARLESKMQYAVSQTAKELSMYYYVLSALGLDEYTTNVPQDDKDRVDLNNTIEALSDFMGDVDDAANIEWDFSSLEKAFESGKNGKETAEELYGSGSKLLEQLKVIGEDPVGKIKVILRMIVSSGFKKHVIAPLLCRELLPKYLTGGEKDIDEYLKNYGVENGINDLDFSYSSLLDDGRSIRIAVVYKVNTKKLTFGLIDSDIILRQVAVTAAWATPNPDAEHPDGKNIKTIAGSVKQNSNENADDPNKGKKK